MSGYSPPPRAYNYNTFYKGKHKHNHKHIYPAAELERRKAQNSIKQMRKRFKCAKKYGFPKKNMLKQWDEINVRHAHNEHKARQSRPHQYRRRKHGRPSESTYEPVTNHSESFPPHSRPQVEAQKRHSKNTGDHTIARRSIALQQSSQIPIFASADLSSGGEIGELDVYDYPSDEPLEEGEIREFPKQMEKPELKRNRRKKRKHRNHNCKARKRRRKGDYDYDSWSTTAVKSDAMDEDVVVVYASRNLEGDRPQNPRGIFELFWLDTFH
eukprot:704418_1